ncbi:delta-1-pyrroline-5-carboxylate dehydrogenase, mitochondrial isoform X2 [Procambarus clarkii]|uniref:delta-1-pyrroline-5-carboxylate dehydrogenase, mitochondrial isoform X2 n=1 Tax=Procambarus clarkii TaxID=6728 RepID=UPI001E6726DA|nr:delta-1-pyrroline-5-carboxylate dehydrogenase, mitochondrial-like isoform X2 [Procambarus clarkii]
MVLEPIVLAFASPLEIFGGAERGVDLLFGLHARAVSTIVKDLQITDFSVENEPVMGYLPGSRERTELEAAIAKHESQVAEVPIMIGDQEYRTDLVQHQVMPHKHSHKLAKFYYATSELVQKAIDTAMAARVNWERIPLNEKFDMWLKAADLMAGKYRQDLNASTMLGQSKTVIQAEIDSAAELIDFFRFNALYAKEGTKWQPRSPEPNVTVNKLRLRGMEGFIAAVSPFNFTAIGGNLAYTPAMMGNVVLWKPSDTAILSNFTIYKIMREAGVPGGVVSFIPADGPVFGDGVTSSPHLAAINFTGSVPTFQRLWSQVGSNLQNYKSFPRLVGECGGKNYHLVHPSADVTSVVNGTIRSAFEYCGQKCSACSRAYFPISLWPEIKEKLLAVQKELKVGDVREFDSFMSAVIDAKAFKRISSYIEHAKTSANTSIIAGGKYDDSVGYFVEPTIVQTTDPLDRIMTEEIFGPILTVYVYPDDQIDDVINLVNTSTPYALTGAIFANDEAWLAKATEALKDSAGNFYINDKSTGSVVAQQPFGGARMSGTNDKAGGLQYALKWTSPQSVKQTFVPLTNIKYPYMG